jgi:hypothetical protein
VEARGEQDGDGHLDDARSGRAAERSRQCAEHLASAGKSSDARDCPRRDRDRYTPVAEHSIEQEAVAEPVECARRQVPARMQHERSARPAEDPPTQRVPPHGEPEDAARDEFERDPTHGDRERGTGAGLVEVITNPSACKPEQLDPVDGPSQRQRYAGMPDELVADEAEPARRKCDARKQTGEP